MSKRKKRAPTPPKKEDDVVITPAGPRPKNKVHPVAPGESIRRNPDGTYSVVPKRKNQDGEKENSNG
jgi:hypothetical protein